MLHGDQDVFSGVTVGTDLVQHKVEMTTDEPSKLRPSECEVGFRTLDLVGHKVGVGQVGLREASVEKIQEAPRPQTNR